MSDVLAIVSKAVFEKAAGKSPVLGQRLGLDRYLSSNRGLAPLAAGGRLFLVTVRPPDEALWLVAVLENPRAEDGAWVASPCDTPLTDVSRLKAQLTFESGKGLPTAAGTLGMSLQTPRVLTAADSALLLAAIGAPASPAAGSASAATAADALAELHAAVVARPLEDEPRRNLGAAWRQRGEPRGELVELDLALRGPLPVYRRAELGGRRRALLKSGARTWWPWPLASYRQRGGFLIAVSAEAGPFLKQAPALFAAEPVTELELLEVDEEAIAALAKAPWLARLRALTVRGPIGDDGLSVLLRAKALAELRALNVASNELSAEGLGALGDRLPALERLVLTANPIGDEGAAALARWRHLGHLRALYLSACELSAPGVTALGDGGSLARLEKLTLSQNELGEAGAAALAALELPALRFLELRDTSLRNGGATALAAGRWPALRRLDLRGNWWQSAALSARYGAALGLSGADADSTDAEDAEDAEDD